MKIQLRVMVVILVITMFPGIYARAIRPTPAEIAAQIGQYSSENCDNDLKRHIQELYSHWIAVYGINWAFEANQLMETLESNNSDYLYFLTCAACVNPRSSNTFLQRLIAGEYDGFSGRIPVGHSKDLVFANIDLLQYFPDSISLCEPIGFQGLLVLRNFGRSAVISGNKYREYLDGFLPKGKSETIQYPTDAVWITTNTMDYPELRTRHFSKYIKHPFSVVHDADDDGIANRFDNNPICGNESYPKKNGVLSASVCRVIFFRFF